MPLPKRSTRSRSKRLLLSDSMKPFKPHSKKKRQSKPVSNPVCEKPILIPDETANPADAIWRSKDEDTTPTLSADEMGKVLPGPTLGEIANQPKEPAVEPHITPFALAHIATQFSLLYKDGQKPKMPESHLPDAYQFIREAAAFLENVAKDQTTYTFDELLAKGHESKSSKGTEPKTPLGGITKKEGLLKAIRREFDYPESEFIIRRGCMTEYEIARLRERLFARRSSNARKCRKVNAVRNER